MVAYLSDAWFNAAEAALAHSDTLRAHAATMRLELHQHVTATPQGDVEYSIRLADGIVSLTVGPNPGATVSFSTSYSIATAIATGSSTAQEAFQSGDLRIGGNIGELMAQLNVLTEIDDVLGPLRSDTEFTDA